MLNQLSLVKQHYGSKLINKIEFSQIFDSLGRKEQKLQLSVENINELYEIVSSRYANTVAGVPFKDIEQIIQIILQPSDIYQELDGNLQERRNYQQQMSSNHKRKEKVVQKQNLHLKRRPKSLNDNSQCEPLQNLTYSCDMLRKSYLEFEEYPLQKSQELNPHHSEKYVQELISKCDFNEMDLMILLIQKLSQLQKSQNGSERNYFIESIFKIIECIINILNKYSEETNKQSQLIIAVQQENQNLQEHLQQCESNILKKEQQQAELLSLLDLFKEENDQKEQTITKMTNQIDYLEKQIEQKVELECQAKHFEQELLEKQTLLNQLKLHQDKTEQSRSLLIQEVAVMQQQLQLKTEQEEKVLQSICQLKQELKTRNEEHTQLQILKNVVRRLENQLQISDKQIKGYFTHIHTLEAQLETTSRRVADLEKENRELMQERAIQQDERARSGLNVGLSLSKQLPINYEQRKSSIISNLSELKRCSIDGNFIYQGNQLPRRTLNIIKKLSQKTERHTEEILVKANFNNGHAINVLQECCIMFKYRSQHSKLTNQKRNCLSSDFLPLNTNKEHKPTMQSEANLQDYLLQYPHPSQDWKKLNINFQREKKDPSINTNSLINESIVKLQQSKLFQDKLNLLSNPHVLQLLRKKEDKLQCTATQGSKQCLCHQCCLYSDGVGVQSLHNEIKCMVILITQEHIFILNKEDFQLDLLFSISQIEKVCFPCQQQSMLCVFRFKNKFDMLLQTDNKQAINSFICSVLQAKGLKLYSREICKTIIYATNCKLECNKSINLSDYLLFYEPSFVTQLMGHSPWKSYYCVLTTEGLAVFEEYKSSKIKYFLSWRSFQLGFEIPDFYFSTKYQVFCLKSYSSNINHIIQIQSAQGYVRWTQGIKTACINALQQ